MFLQDERMSSDLEIKEWMVVKKKTSAYFVILINIRNLTSNETRNLKLRYIKFMVTDYR